MNVALIGSVSSSWNALDALTRGGVELTAVFGVDESRRDRISDYRSLRELAKTAGAAFHSFVKVADPNVEAALKSNPPDLLWVIGLSQLVPDRLIRIARCGGVGFHPTMLPEGRGRAPVAWTILRRARAAVTLFFLADEPDAGDIIVQREVPVMDDDYSEDLIHRTNLALSEVVLELAPRIRSGDLPRQTQDHARATYYPKRTPADGLINWSASTDAVYRLIRAAGRPYPGAFTHCQGRRMTIWRARPALADEVGAAYRRVAGATRFGRVITTDEQNRVLVSTADGGLWLTEIETDDNAQAFDLLAVGAQLG